MKRDLREIVKLKHVLRCKCYKCSDHFMIPKEEYDIFKDCYGAVFCRECHDKYHPYGDI